MQLEIRALEILKLVNHSKFVIIDPYVRFLNGGSHLGCKIEFEINSSLQNVTVNYSAT